MGTQPRLCCGCGGWNKYKKRKRKEKEGLEWKLEAYDPLNEGEVAEMSR